LSEVTRTDIPAADTLGSGRRRWIDVLLVAAGASLVAASPEVGTWLSTLGIPLVALGLLTPLLRWSGRSRGIAGAVHLVPPELAESHRGVRAAASLPGVVDGPAAVDVADDSLLEVAALLGGGLPRGATQRRFVAARVRAMTAAAADLEQQHQAWVAAIAEVDALAPSPPLEAPLPRRDGPLVGVLVLVLLPGFLAWDLLCATARAGVALVEGLALRLRMASRLLARAASAAGALVGRARDVWTSARKDLAVATREAHHRVTAARIRLRLRLRRARRVAGA
jgi:hypothetical protein